MAEPLRVALCDDHGMVRAGLRRVLAEDGPFDVVGDAATGEEAVALARAERPDVFVVDLNLGGVSGIDVIRQITAASPATAVLVLTADNDLGSLRRAFAAGARGYLVKHAAGFDLALAVRRVAAGQEHVDPRLAADLLDPGAGGPGELSETERRILELVARGYTNAEVATDLGVSLRTVEGRRAALLRKLGLKTRAELVRFARQVDEQAGPPPPESLER